MNQILANNKIPAHSMIGNSLYGKPNKPKIRPIFFKPINMPLGIVPLKKPTS
jgi:hypothetical protein